MAQDEVVVVGIDVAKDKVDACIRSLSQRQTFASTAEGRRALIRWLRKHRVGKAAMEASGGYEQDWAKALREARIEVRIVDPKRVRSFARSAGRLAKNDPIDAEMIAWFAETFTEAPGQAYDAARERLVKIVNARQGLLDLQTSLKNSGEHTVPDVVQKMQARLLKKIAVEVAKLETAIAAQVKATTFCRARRDHRERAGTWQDHVRRTDRDDAGTGPGERQYRRGLVGGSTLRRR
jgi:transposase